MPGEQSRINGRKNKNQGRPKSTATIEAQLFRESLATRIGKDADRWLTSIDDAANGHFVEVKTKDGQVKVYKKAPNPQAWEKAMDRAFGKPEQPVDHTTKGEKLEGSISDASVQKLVSEFENKLRENLEK